MVSFFLMPSIRIKMSSFLSPSVGGVTFGVRTDDRRTTVEHDKRSGGAGPHAEYIYACSYGRPTLRSGMIQGLSVTRSAAI